MINKPEIVSMEAKFLQKHPAQTSSSKCHLKTGGPTNKKEKKTIQIYIINIWHERCKQIITLLHNFPHCWKDMEAKICGLWSETRIDQKSQGHLWVPAHNMKRKIWCEAGKYLLRPQSTIVSFQLKKQVNASNIDVATGKIFII